MDWNRKHKISQSGNKIWLFPTPVIKNQKYLIECESIELAKTLEKIINEKLIEENSEAFVLAGKHTDGSSSIFKVEKKFVVLKFLPNRDKDLAHAHSIESSLSQALMIGDIQKTQRLYSAQLKCSSCQKLGIDAPEVKKLLDECINIWLSKET
jgi:hypothetical protein